MTKTLTVRTKAGTTVEVAASRTLIVEEGLFGFDGKERFVLMPQAKGEASPFLWLQSLDDPDLAFLCIDPRFFRPDYVPLLPPSEWEALGTTPDEAVILVLVVVPEDPKEMTANLLGPLVFSPKTRRGRQVVSQDPNHRVRHKVLEELAELRAKRN